MRGELERQGVMLSVVSPEHRIRRDHPLRRIKAMADAELARLSPVFDAMYAERGRRSIPPERLLKACLLIALYSVRSERQLCEQLEYNLLFRWFLDMGMHEEVFDASTFAKNKERLLRAEVAARFFEGIVAQAQAARLLSAEHFTVDGTLIEAWASLKRFRRRDARPGDGRPPDDPGNPTVNFHGERRTNATHVSLTDVEAELARKGDGKEAKLAFAGHVLMENRHGLCVDIAVTRAVSTTEREAGLALVRRGPRARPAHPHVGRGQGVRYAGVCVRAAGGRRDTPHRAEHHDSPRLDARLADASPPRLPTEPALSEEDRGGLRLGKDDRGTAQDPLPRRRPHRPVGLSRGRRLQPAPDDKAAARGDRGMSTARTARPDAARERDAGHPTATRSLH